MIRVKSRVLFLADKLLMIKNPIHATTFVDLLQQRARHQPEKLAYTFLLDGETEHASITYAQLDRRACVIAAIVRVTAKVKNPVGDRADEIECISIW